jgi:hypothetical protein
MEETAPKNTFEALCRQIQSAEKGHVDCLLLAGYAERVEAMALDEKKTAKKDRGRLILAVEKARQLISKARSVQESEPEGSL